MRGGRIVVTGGAGLVGQNLIMLMKREGWDDVVAIDKHPENTAILRQLHPDIEVVEADLSQPGEWMEAFSGAAAVVLSHAQIGGLDEKEFYANNVGATVNILEAARRAGVTYLVHLSSSVVNSIAEDDYVRSKTEQEKLVSDSGFEHVILRPTLMFGWFDRKHLGWLSRFMQRVPVFPVPGHGRYIRQPLYALDFCAIILACLKKRQTGAYNISGQERVHYIDLIRELKRASGARARIVKIPYHLFWWLLKIYALFDRDPPFTTKQLEALVIPETFEVIDWPSIFDVEATPLADALAETHQHPENSKIVLEF